MSVEIHMLPVKAGDATLIIDCESQPRFAVLIDTGLADQEVVEYLKRKGVDRLDLVIVSHPDLDHLKGLLEIVKDKQISVGEIWCFDLKFLRDFVTSGRLPKPQPGTHRFVYDKLIMSLILEDKVLKEANLRGIKCLQVSEGYRMNVGNLHIEVLYPWDKFYKQLCSPKALKELLKKRLPDDWLSPEWNDEPGRPLARPVGERSDKLLEGPPFVEVNDVLNTPLATHESEEGEKDTEPGEDDQFPISLLGTLYNNLSIVVRIYVTGGIAPLKLLFPGDLTDWTYLVARRPFDLRADIFKYPHHGSSGPGVSQQFFRKLGCLPWPSCRPCCHHACWLYWKEFWEMLYEGKLKGSSLFCKLVNPTHTLIFPYPPKLPKPGVIISCLGKTHANRQNQSPDQLAATNNAPSVCVLSIDERGRISVHP